MKKTENKDEKEFSAEVIAQYKRLQDANNSINIYGITILTGNNGSGKSLIRKQLPFKFRDEFKLGDAQETKGMIKSTSMDARTESRPERNALSSSLNDTSWIATSQNTFHCISGLLDAVEDGKTKYVVIDEYEIGCSEETIMSIACYISYRLNELITNKKLIGAMVITHSRIGVKNIRHDHFVNIEGLDEGRWLTREVAPTDLDVLEKNELFLYIRDNKDKEEAK